MSEAPIVVEGLCHAYGEGSLRRQVLFDVSAVIEPGEIVILTGPSGSGKTTLLTLMGALRSAQEGSLRVLGQELRGAREGVLASVRRRIGYVFQAHNLLEALTAQQNVRMPLQVHAELGAADAEARAARALAAVGLGDRPGAHPSELSGGQRQRVAIARALAVEPEILLADEPTASLDRVTGRAVVELLERLAREQGVTVVLVTHDSRILDVADRVLALEDGRLSSLMNAVTSDAQQRLATLARDIRRGDLPARLARMAPETFAALLDEVTDETRRLMAVVDLARDEAFGPMLEQVSQAFAAKVAELLDAEDASLLFLDEERGGLWSLGSCQHGRPHERTAPLVRGIAGHVARTGRSLNVADVVTEPLFDPEVDAGRSPVRSLLCAPVADSRGHRFAVVELRNKRGGAFSDADAVRLERFTASLGTILESWWRMGCACRDAGVGRTPSCCAVGQPG